MPDPTPNPNPDITSPPPGGNGAGPDFSTLIPQEYKGHPSLAPIKDMGGLVKSFISAQEMVGKNKVVLPGENATEQDWAEFYGKLGRPESPDKYGIAPPKDLPEGFQVNEEYLKTLGTLFHKHGLTTKQAQALFNDLNGVAVESFKKESETSTASRTEAMAKLRTDFGAQFDIKIDAARRAVSAFVSDEQKQWLAESGLGSDHNMIRIFSEVGMKLAEHSTEGGGDGGGFGSNLSPSQAQAEITQLQSDSEFMKQYMDQYHPQHAVAVKRMESLFSRAYPSEKQ
jgi:hypothetical protein